MLNNSKSWLPVFLWMGFIFLMSTDVGSAEHTSRIIVPLLRWLDPEISTRTIDLAQTVIRKSAHLSEYAILGLLSLRAARKSLSPRPTGNLYRAAGIALLIVVAYAATDEFHQSFVPSRGASAYDVLIDTSGAFAALTAAVLWHRIRRPADGGA